MDRKTAKACFSLIMKLNDSPRWRRAVSWLYHGEQEIEVKELMLLNDDQMKTAKQAVSVLDRINADYDEVYAWSKRVRLSN